jgi:geranylgeranylglycerol-phosphate geranylgeranyltransferase
VSLLDRTQAVVDLARPGNVLMAAIGAAIGALVAAGAGSWAALALAATATALVTAGGNALNGVVDREIDARAHPERPIPSGRIPAVWAKAIAIVAFLGALAAGLAVSVELLAVVVGAEGLLVAYEAWGKQRGFVGNMLVAGLVAATFVAGAVAVHRVTGPVGFLAGLALLANVARETWKDVEDAAHDEGRATLARTHGPDVADRVAQAATLAAVGLSVVPYLIGFGGWPYLAVVAIADIVFALAVFASTASRAQRLSKAAMALALVAFALGGVL